MICLESWTTQESRESVLNAPKPSGLKITGFPFYNQNGIEVRMSKNSDSFILKNEDAEEVFYSHGLNPEEALAFSLNRALISYTVTINGSPEMMFGINPISLLGNTATIWMLSSEKINNINLRFLRHSRNYVNHFLGLYKELFNYVWIGNIKTIRWLKSIGAEFEYPKNYGIHRKLFMKFSFKE